MANDKYREWMRQLNEIAARRGFIYCRNRYTWAAYRAGMTPAAYVESKKENGR